MDLKIHGLNGASSPHGQVRERQPVAWRLFFLALILGAGGCAAPGPPASASAREFRMYEDSVSYANELVWEYRFDPVTDEVSHHDREPPPTYTHHCFVLAKSVRQFFEHARFRPDRPRADERTYRRLIRHVTGIDPARHVPEAKKIIIPGYTNLYEFSRDWEKALQEECGGAWRSYTQRGHWRMVFPFSRKHQTREAARLQEALDRGHPPVVHVVQFPSLTINHALILIGHHETAQDITFTTYDPNRPDQLTTLTFDKRRQTFRFPRNHYFVGGDVDIYEVYKSWNY